MKPVLSVRGAAFGYGRHPVVAGIDLEVGPGQILGVAGPNGSGKTTFFRGLAGLLPAMEGSVERFGGPLGYVPQREALDAIYPLTVEEVVRMGAYGRLFGLRRLRAEDVRLARACLERVGLDDRRRRAFASLSGGQRQRALIARALMVRPRLLLLDEPTSGIDSATVERIVDLLTELAREEGVAILVVSHQLELLREAVRDVLWVAEGRVERTPFGSATWEELTGASLRRAGEP